MAVVATASPALQRLSEAAGAVGSSEFATASDAELALEITALRRVIDLLELASCRRIRAFEQRDGHVRQGAPSMVAWLREHCRLTVAGAAKRVEIGRNLTQVDGAESALERGSIGFAHAAVLARSVTELGPEKAGRVSPDLLSAAPRVDPDALRSLAREQRFSLDPTGADADANRQHERRRLTIHPTFDGPFMIDGRLGADDGVTLRAAIDELSRPVPGEQRTAAQRRADALVELATRYLQRPGAHSAGRAVQVLLTATSGSEAGAGAHLMGIGAVPAATARRLTCDASLIAVEVQPSGDPLTVGRARRTIPPSIRRALEHRDGGCSFPRCDRPLPWTEAHHLRHWADGGETSMANLALLCRFHHRMVHEQGWSLHRGPDGSMLAEPP